MPGSRKPLGTAFTPTHERLLRRMWSFNGIGIDEVARQLSTTADELRDELRELVEIGVVVLDDGVVALAPPREALATLLARESETIAGTLERLNRMAGIVVALGREATPRRDLPIGSVENLADVEIVRGSPPGGLLHEWIDAGLGTLKFMRPEQWRLPIEPVTAEAFRRALSAGHEVQCIYPVRALHLAKSVLMEHAATGEQIRLLGEVPLQMALVGDSHAMLVAGWEGEGLVTAVVREPIIVGALVDYFDTLWQQGAALPGLDPVRVRSDDRRLLLQALAQGERDEQIARSLGIGLRTVRRRVADLMIELGVETRFQAGVEVARRGWV